MTRKLLSTIDCCPVLDAPLSRKDAERLAAGFKVLSDPARLRLLSLIAAQPEGQACTCDLTDPMGLTQPTVTHHLQVLYGAGLVEKERRGSWTVYRVIPSALQALRDVLG